MTERERMEIETFALTMLWHVGEVDPSPYNFSRELITVPRIIEMAVARYGQQGREVLQNFRITLH